MTARDALFRRVAGAFVDEDKANAIIDAYRDEVLREAAQALFDLLDDDDSFNALMAKEDRSPDIDDYAKGAYAVAEVLECMAKESA